MRNTEKNAWGAAANRRPKRGAGTQQLFEDADREQVVGVDTPSLSASAAGELWVNRGTSCSPLRRWIVTGAMRSGAA